MRIAIVNWNRRRIGGAETYVNDSIQALHQLGHQLFSLTEVDQGVAYEEIHLPQGSPAFCVAESGRACALAALGDWLPDVIYAHGIHDTKLERDLIGLAPSIFFAHTFTGTCISGQKTFKSPVVQPCTRKFGWQCLLHYYPHRCGGLNPFTMTRMYQTQKKRLENLHQYDAIVTHSSYMYEEFINNGFEPGRVHRLSERPHTNQFDFPKTKSKTATATQDLVRAPSRLLYIGRMEFLKGGEVFLDALENAQVRLSHPLRVTFAGDGGDRGRWESRARQVQSTNSQLSIEFAGWLRGDDLTQALRDSDLLVLPSLWPEPFGLVGLEAGKLGVPVAAFAAGGIPDWLLDGINGHLAPSDPPTASGLADAIVNSLQDPAHYVELRRGAVKISESLGMNTEVNAFLAVLEQVGFRPNSPGMTIIAEVGR